MTSPEKKKGKRTLTPEHRAAISATLRSRNASRRQAEEAAAQAATRRLTHQKKGGPPAHRAAVKRAQVLERRARVWRLFVGGEGFGNTTMQDIANQIGCSKFQVWSDINEVANELNAQIFRNAEAMRARAGSELAAIRKAHWQKREQEGHARILLQTLEREAKLFNLDLRPPESGFTPDQLVSLMKGVAGLFMSLVSDTEMRRQFVEGLRRQLGQPIDTEPVAVEPKEE